jgi:hypothetical protein
MVVYVWTMRLNTVSLRWCCWNWLLLKRLRCALDRLPYQVWFGIEGYEATINPVVVRFEPCLWSMDLWVCDTASAFWPLQDGFLLPWHVVPVVNAGKKEKRAIGKNAPRGWKKGQGVGKKVPTLKIVNGGWKELRRGVGLINPRVQLFPFRVPYKHIPRWLQPVVHYMIPVYCISDNGMSYTSVFSQQWHAAACYRTTLSVYPYCDLKDMQRESS